MAIVVALAIGAFIMVAALWVVRLLAAPPPSDPDPEDVIPVEQTYRCAVCGLQLTVTFAHGDHQEPPRHCREEMEPA
ncbi:MAG: hypothetical protein ACE5E8_00695 [Acidimicrobiia bacterium]